MVIGSGVPMVRFICLIWVITFTINLYGLIICMAHLHAGGHSDQVNLSPMCIRMFH